MVGLTLNNFGFIKLQLLGASHVKYWQLSNVSAIIAVAIVRVNMHWSVSLGLM
jgi:hypothetical protein